MYTERMSLFRTAAGWFVRTDNPETIRLFGTDVLPTAFTYRADPERVLAAIKKLNPGADVFLEREG